MKLSRITKENGEVYFINSRTGERVEVDPMLTKRKTDPAVHKKVKLFWLFTGIYPFILAIIIVILSHPENNSDFAQMAYVIGSYAFLIIIPLIFDLTYMLIKRKLSSLTFHIYYNIWMTILFLLNLTMILQSK